MSKLRKRDIPSTLKTVDDWQAKNQPRIDKLKPAFREWIETELDELRDRIRGQDFLFALQSTTRHIASTLDRMEDGTIKAVTSTGGFKL